MRPRPDAAENADDPIERKLDGSASMRPRPDAAENARHGCGVGGRRRASMRPRPDAAENVEVLIVQRDAAGLLQ